MLDNNSKSRTFIVWSDEIEGRIDPFFYDPKIVKLIEKLKKKKTYKLGDLMSDISGGATPRVTEDFYLETGGIPFLRVQNITEEGIKLDDVKYIKPEVHENQLKRSQLKADDVVFTITGRIGSVAVVPDDFEGNINQHSVRFHLKEEIEGTKILPEYIAVYFNTDFGRALSLRNVTGGTRPALDYVALRDLDVPLPTLAVQKKVVEKVKNVYEQKRKKEEEIKKILASIDDFVLGELGIEIPEGGAERVYEVWSDEILGGRLDPFFYKPYLLNLLRQIKKQRHFALGDAIIDMSGGATPKVTEDYYADETGVPFLRVQNITEEGINLEDAKYIKREIHETMLKRSQLKKDDLVFTITGRIGSVAVVPENFEGNINQHSVRFHLCSAVNNVEILPQYVAAFLNTTTGRDLSFRSTTGGTRPALDYEALKELAVPLPNVEKQREIVSGVQSSYSKIRTLRAQAAEVLTDAQKQVEQMILN